MFVCARVHQYEREVTTNNSTRAKKFSFSASLDCMGHYKRQPTDMAGYGPSHDYIKRAASTESQGRI